ncbi:unnamed protein product [Prorocentrum cordatum]|uniref:Uncharacterized protein n=1 Tax=Prorocentrum cordatum TaxID=2364126 RepID=A0ABN9WWN9_9DINO|nr:unnamed protein product [Polarella glacialis]
MASPVSSEQAVEVLVTQLNQRSEIVTLQRSIGIDVSDAKANAFMLHLSQVQNLSLAGAARLTRQVGLGPWSQTQSSGIAGAINACTSRSEITGGKRDVQTCETLERYFTQRPHDYFKTEAVDVDVASRMVAVQLYKLGLVCPSNQVLKRATGIMQLAGLKVMSMSPSSQSSIGKAILGYVKAMGKEKRFPLAHILQYPSDPMELPPAHIQHAYGGEMPVPFVIDGLQLSASTCCYRKSHNGMKDQQGAAPNQQTNEQMMAAAVTSAMAPFAQDCDPVGELEAVVRDAAEGAKHRASRKTKGPKTQTKKAGRAAAASVLASARRGGKAAGKGGRGGRGGKAAGKGGASAGSGGKAAGKGGAGRRIAEVSASDFRSEATCTADYPKGKNDFTSRAHGVARRRCASSGMSDAAAKIVAREFHAMAARSFERVFGKGQK